MTKQATIYVDTLPKQIKTPTGVIANPSIETCRKYGYELTPLEIRQQREQQQLQAEAAIGLIRQAKEDKATAIKNTMTQCIAEFCRLANIEASAFSPQAINDAVSAAVLQRNGVATQIELLTSALAYTMAAVQLLTLHDEEIVVEPQEPIVGGIGDLGVITKP